MKIYAVSYNFRLLNLSPPQKTKFFVNKDHATKFVQLLENIQAKLFPEHDIGIEQAEITVEELPCSL